MAPNKIEKVAIVGAGGRIGRAFAESLVATGQHTVTALTREGSTTAPVAGTKVVAVDYSDEASLVNALRGQQFLVITLSVRAPEETHTRLVHAAAKAGVPYVMPNIYGGDPNNKSLMDDSVMGRAYRARLNDFETAAGPSFFILACGQWYEWSLGLGKPWFGFDIRAREVTFYDDGKTAINVSTWDQCGRALASFLSLPKSGASPCVADYKNSTLYISSFVVSQRDMLDSLHRVLGTSDKDWKIDYEGTKERYERGMSEMKAGNRSGFATALYARVFYPQEEGTNTGSEFSNNVLALPQENLDEITKRTIDMVEGGYVEETFKALMG